MPPFTVKAVNCGVGIPDSTAFLGEKPRAVVDFAHADGSCQARAERSSKRRGPCCAVDLGTHAEPALECRNGLMQATFPAHRRYDSPVSSASARNLGLERSIDEIVDNVRQVCRPSRGTRKRRFSDHAQRRRVHHGHGIIKHVAGLNPVNHSASRLPKSARSASARTLVRLEIRISGTPASSRDVQQLRARRHLRREWRPGSR